MVNFKCEASFYKTFDNRSELLKKFVDVCNTVRDALSSKSPIFKSFDVDLSVDSVLRREALKSLIAIFVDDVSNPQIVVTIAIHENTLRVYIACSILGLQQYFNKIFKVVEDLEPEIFICG